jgi:non-specific serine/threonine protein kinase/serine/threonine-protein kinase
MALEYLDRLAQEAGDDASLQRELIAAYQKVGDVRGNPTNANLGDTAGALASYQEALTMAKALVRAHPADREAQRSLAIVYEKMGDLQSWTGHLPDAVENTRLAVALLQRLADSEPANVNTRQLLAVGHIKLGDILGDPDFPNIGDRVGALDQYRQSLALLQVQAASDSTNATTRRHLGNIHERIGMMQQVEGKLAEALESYRRSLEIREAFSADNPTNTDASRDVAVGHEKMADVLLATGNTARALEDYRTALSMFETLLAADSNNTEARRDVAGEYKNISDALVKTGDVAGALDTFLKSLAMIEALSTADPTNVQKLRDLAVSYAGLGDLYTRSALTGTIPVSRQSEHWRQARSWYQRSLNIWLDLRQRSALQTSDTNLPDEISGKIAQCDASLAKLRK